MLFFLVSGESFFGFVQRHYIVTLNITHLIKNIRICLNAAVNLI